MQLLTRWWLGAFRACVRKDLRCRLIWQLTNNWHLVEISNISWRKRVLVQVERETDLCDACIEELAGSGGVEGGCEVVGGPPDENGSHLCVSVSCCVHFWWVFWHRGNFGDRQLSLNVVVATQSYLNRNETIVKNYVTKTVSGIFSLKTYHTAVTSHFRDLGSCFFIKILPEIP